MAISWCGDYREDADSVQALASDWSTQITWPQCPPLIGRGWRMQMVTGGQTLSTASAWVVVWTQRGPVWSLKVGSRVLGWVLGTRPGQPPSHRPDPGCTSWHPHHPRIRFPLPDTRGAPAAAVVQQCTVHRLTKSRLLAYKIKDVFSSLPISL